LSTISKLGKDIRKLIELRIEQTLIGIEDTITQLMENQDFNMKELKQDVQSLAESFNILSQKWNLQILYILFLTSKMRYAELKKTLEINSRTLSDKLKSLCEVSFVERNVDEGPPLEVSYTLTKRGSNVILLALPLLYYTQTDLSEKSLAK
jgi:DNA-binding HxlR family transcriptional regulator